MFALLNGGSFRDWRGCYGEKRWLIYYSVYEQQGNKKQKDRKKWCPFALSKLVAKAWKGSVLYPRRHWAMLVKCWLVKVWVGQREQCTRLLLIEYSNYSDFLWSKMYGDLSKGKWNIWNSQCSFGRIRVTRNEPARINNIFFPLTFLYNILLATLSWRRCGVAVSLRRRGVLSAAPAPRGHIEVILYCTVWPLAWTTKIFSCKDDLLRRSDSLKTTVGYYQ